MQYKSTVIVGNIAQRLIKTVKVYVSIRILANHAWRHKLANSR